MGSFTGFLNLFKYAQADFQDVDPLNQNMDKLDTYFKDSDKFIPLPLGSSAADAANWNNPFGFPPGYVDKGDYYILRGVAAHVVTTSLIVANTVMARLPSSAPYAQYFLLEGSGNAIVNAQVIAGAGPINCKATPFTGDTYWVSFDNMKVWK